MSPFAVQLSGLSKRYPGGAGVQGLNLTVSPGEIFGFLGPNGAGKTTTLRTLMGFLRPTAGQAWVFGQDVWRERERVHARVGYLPGEVRLPPALNAGTLLRRAAELRGQPMPPYAREVAARLDLNLERRVGTLSKGNRQKVGLVLALMFRPDLLILDEPTDGLDPLAQATVLELLREACAEGRTVLLSSHVLSEVQQVAGRVGLIRAGELVRVEDLATLRASLPQLLHAEFAGGVPPGLSALSGLRVLRESATELHAEWRGEPGPLLRVFAGERVLSFSLTPATLEDAFLSEYRPAAAPEVGRG